MIHTAVIAVLAVELAAPLGTARLHGAPASTERAVAGAAEAELDAATRLAVDRARDVGAPAAAGVASPVPSLRAPWGALMRFAALFGATPGAVAAASDAQKAKLSVDGAITFEVSVIAADVRVERGAADVVEVELDGSRNGVSLVKRGSRVVASFPKGPLRSGDLRVRLPSGSGLVVQGVSGDIVVVGVGGDAEVRAVSGDVTVDGAAGVSVQAVSGDVQLAGIKGPVRLETVSGDASVASVSARAQLRFATTSGAIRWSGRCADGCRIRGESLSGRVSLRFAQDSSFDLGLETFSGGLDDELGLQDLQRKGASGRGMRHRGRYGKGAGSVAIETFSGTLEIGKKD